MLASMCIIWRGFCADFSQTPIHSWMERWEQVPGQPNCPMDELKSNGECARAHDVIKPLGMEFHEAALKFAEPRKRKRGRE